MKFHRSGSSLQPILARAHGNCSVGDQTVVGIRPCQWASWAVLDLN